MKIQNHPFLALRPDDPPRPYLPVTIINPDNGRKINVLALIDTGADECALPASFAPILGHNLQAGQAKKVQTGNGLTLAYAHTTSFQLGAFQTGKVLIDFLPNLSIPLLGVKSFLGNFILTIDYPGKTFSLVPPENH